MRSKVLIVLLPLLLAAGCAGKMDAKRGLSEEWRLRSLEENFLNFKEGQRQQEEQIDGQQRKVLDRVKALEEAVVQLQEQAGATPVRRMEAAPMPMPVPVPTPALTPAPAPAPAHSQTKAAPVQPKAARTKTKGVYSPPKPVPSQPDSMQPKPGTAHAAPEAAASQPSATHAAPIAPEVVQGASESPEDKPWAVVPGQEHASPPATTADAPAMEQGASTSSTASTASTASTSSTQPSPPAPSPSAGPQGGTAQYNEGMSLVRAEKAEPGRKLLEDFLAAAPESSLVPNAIYWIGESYFVEKNYPQAILTFKDVTRRFPKHHKAAAALLKIGMCYEKLGEKDNAALYLRALLKDYPKSEPAPFARKKLAELGG